MNKDDFLNIFIKRYRWLFPMSIDFIILHTVLQTSDFVSLYTKSMLRVMTSFSDHSYQLVYKKKWVQIHMQKKYAQKAKKVRTTDMHYTKYSIMYICAPYAEV